MVALAVSCLISTASAEFLEKKDFPTIPQLKKFNMNVEAVEDNGGDFLKIYALDDTNPRAIRNIVAYSTKSGSTLLYGQGLQLDQADGKQAFPMDPKLVDEIKKEAIFTVGSGKEEYIVFTDPECPYCQKFDTALKDLDPNVKLYVLLYPLSFHKKAVQMSSYVMDGGTNAEKHKRLASVTNPGGEWAKYNKPLAVEKIKNQMLLGMKLGVQGTPAIFSGKSGTSVEIQSFMQQKIKVANQTSNTVPAEVAVNPKALEFFKTQDLVVKLNPESTKPALFVFASIEDDKSQKLFANTNKLTDSYNVSVVLFPGDSQGSIMKTLDVYITAEAGRLAKAKTYLSGADMSKADGDALNAKLVEKSEAIKAMVGKVSMLKQASVQMQIPNMPTGVKLNGKYQNIDSFYK